MISHPTSFVFKIIAYDFFHLLTIFLFQFPKAFNFCLASSSDLPSTESLLTSSCWSRLLFSPSSSQAVYFPSLQRSASWLKLLPRHQIQYLAYDFNTQALSDLQLWLLIFYPSLLISFLSFRFTASSSSPLSLAILHTISQTIYNSLKSTILVYNSFIHHYFTFFFSTLSSIQFSPSVYYDSTPCLFRIQNLNTFLSITTFIFFPASKSQHPTFTSCAY